MKLFQSRHLAAETKLKRRVFLKAAGLGLSVPVAATFARFAVAQSSRTTRLFIYYIPSGAPTEHFHVEADMDLSARGVGVLSPLDPYKKYLTIPQGLGMPTSAGISHDAIGGILTGDHRGGHNSIDYLISEQLGIPAHVLGVHCYPDASVLSSGHFRFAHHNGWVAPLMKPADAYEELFAGLSSAEGGSDPDPSLEFRRTTLELTASEVEKLRGELGGLAPEQSKLDDYLASLQSRRESLEPDQATISCDVRPSLQSVEDVRGVDPFELGRFSDLLRAQLEIAATAFVCGTARIITHQNMHAHSDYPMDFAGGPGVSEEYHNVLSHTPFSGTPALREKYGLVQKWFYQMLADHFLTHLEVDDPLNPGSTILDNTTVLVCSEVGDGNDHNNVPRANPHTSDGGSHINPFHLPWVLIGGGGGYFAGNRVAELLPLGEGYAPNDPTFAGLDTRIVLSALAESMNTTVSYPGVNTEIPSELKG